MKWEDIVALAKAGYKPADVKELMAMEQKKQEPEPEPKQEPEQEPKQEPEPEPKQEPKQEPDYKKMYEESQEALKQAQAKNTRMDASKKDGTEKDDAELLQDWARSFM